MKGRKTIFQLMGDLDPLVRLFVDTRKREGAKAVTVHLPGRPTINV